MIRNSTNAIGDITTVLQERGFLVHHGEQRVSDFGERTYRARVGLRSGSVAVHRMNEAACQSVHALHMMGWVTVAHLRADEAPVVEVLLTVEDT